jgi:hypothetical protein
MDFVIVTWRTKSHVAEAMLLFPTTDSVKLPGTTTGTVPNALFMFSPGASDVQSSKLGVALKRGMMLQPYEPVICDIGACVSLVAKTCKSCFHSSMMGFSLNNCIKASVFVLLLHCALLL